MDTRKAKQILEEAAKRQKASQIDFFDGSFPEQTALINDTSDYISVLCSRRAAKSYSIGLKMMKCCLENPGVVCVYLGLTRESASRIMINPILREINKKYSLGVTFGKVPLHARFPNGSIIYLGGVNNSENEQEKLRGQKYKIIAIDECASYTIDLQSLLNNVLGATTIDLGGQIIMLGTPGNIRNYFYNVTEGLTPGWSKHKWLTSQNPHTAKRNAAKMAKMQKDQPGIEKTAWFRQEYLAEWIVDTDKLLYKFSDNNLIDKLPLDKDQYTYILGMDLGYNDATTFCVGAYSQNDPTLYIVYSYGKSQMLLDNIVTEIDKIKKLFPIAFYIIDSASKQVVEDLRYRTRIPFQAATKTDKLQTIHMLNNDLQTSRIKIFPSNFELIDQLRSLLIDDSNPQDPREVPSQKNDFADSFLYTWRKSMHYLSRPIELKPKLTANEMADQLFEKARSKFNNRDKDPTKIFFE